MNITFWGIVKSSLPVIWNLWPVWLMVIAIIIIKIMMEIVLPREFREIRNLLNFKRGKDWRSDRDLLQWLRAMKPSEFEEYISTLFSKLGFKTKTVGGAYDGGIDVVAEKDGIKHYIQCKKFITSKVTVHDMRDFYGALADKLVSGKGYFITTNVFTLEAERFAEDKPIELIDGNKLIQYIKSVKK